MQWGKSTFAARESTGREECFDVVSRIRTFSANRGGLLRIPSSRENPIYLEKPWTLLHPYTYLLLKREGIFPLKPKHNHVFTEVVTGGY